LLGLIPPLAESFQDVPLLLLQLQNNRICYNWRKLSGQGDYPKYETIWEPFITNVDKFKAFISENGIGELGITQYELTYFNHITKNDITEDLSKIIPSFCWNDRKWMR
jgi:hypothetical protein